jgi:hypothetical protein
MFTAVSPRGVTPPISGETKALMDETRGQLDLPKTFGERNRIDRAVEFS